VTLFSTASTTPSDVWIPIPVEPSCAAEGNVSAMSSSLAEGVPAHGPRNTG